MITPFQQHKGFSKYRETSNDDTLVGVTRKVGRALALARKYQMIIFPGYCLKRGVGLVFKSQAFFHDLLLRNKQLKKLITAES